MRFGLVEAIQELNAATVRADAWIAWEQSAAGELSVREVWGFGDQDISERHAQWKGNAELIRQSLSASRIARATAQIVPVGGQARPLETVAVPLESERPLRAVQFFFLDTESAGRLFVQGLPAEIRLNLLQEWNESPAATNSSGPAAAASAVAAAGITDRQSPAAEAERHAEGSGPWLDEVCQLLEELTPPERIGALLNQICLRYGLRRCSLYSRQRGRTELLGISGALRPDSRSTSIQDLKQLAGDVRIETNRPIEQIELAETAVEAAADPLAGLSGEIWLWLLSPVSERSPQSAFLFFLLETGSPGTGEALVSRWQAERSAWLLAVTAATASPRGLSGQRTGGVGRVVAGVLLLAGLAIPIPLKVTAPGYFWPVRRANLFAPESGVIAAADLTLPPDRNVREGQLLLTITSRELELELGRVDGELATLEEQIRSLQSTRTQRGLEAGERPTVESDVSLRLAEWNSRRDGLMLERELLRQRQAALKIPAPLDGQILNWEAETELAGRPVARGQLLLMIGDSSGGWEIQAEVREEDLGLLKRGLERSAVVRVHPNDTRWPALEGTAAELSPMVTPGGPGESVARWRVDPGPVTPPPLPGARVRVVVDCGSFPAGYVWFRGLFELIGRQLTW